MEGAEGMDMVVWVGGAVDDGELEGWGRDMASEPVKVEADGSGEMMVPADRVVLEGMEEGWAARVFELAGDCKVTREKGDSVELVDGDVGGEGGVVRE